MSHMDDTEDEEPETALSLAFAGNTVQNAGLAGGRLVGVAAGGVAGAASVNHMQSAVRHAN